MMPRNADLTQLEYIEFLADADKFEEYRAIALGKLAKAILDSYKFKSIIKSNREFVRCISGTGLLRALEVALSKADKTIIEFRFAINGVFMTQKEIGKILVLSDAAISKRQMVSIDKLVDYHKLYFIPVTQRPTGSQSSSDQEISIEDCELSVRAYNCLKRAGILTLHQFSKMSLNEQRLIRNLGGRCLKEVHDCCYSHFMAPYQE